MILACPGLRRRCSPRQRPSPSERVRLCLRHGSSVGMMATCLNRPWGVIPSPTGPTASGRRISIAGCRKQTTVAGFYYLQDATPSS
eukprot:10394742-Heterocapsa_arctica.AAC.1